jgi:hypothetical protein
MSVYFGEVNFDRAQTATSSATFALDSPEPSNVQREDTALMDEARGKNLHRQGFHDLNAADSGLVNHHGGGTKSFGSQDDASDPVDGGGVTHSGGAGASAGTGTSAGGNSGGGTHAKEVKLPEQQASTDSFDDNRRIRRWGNVFVTDPASYLRLAQVLGALGKLHGMNPGSIRLQEGQFGQLRVDFSRDAEALMRRALQDVNLDPALRGLFETALGGWGNWTLSKNPKGPGFDMNRGWPAPTKGPPEWFVRARGILTAPIGIAEIGLGILSGGLLGGAGILNGIDATGTGLAEAITGQEKPTMMQAGVDHAGNQLGLTPEQKEIVDEWWYWTNLIITIGNIGKAASKPAPPPNKEAKVEAPKNIRGTDKGTGKPVGKVQPSKNGNVMHERIVAWLKKHFPDSEFDVRIRPGQNGIDIKWTGRGADPGFKYAEIKPKNADGSRRLFNQIMNIWGLELEDVLAITYDDLGNIYWGF